MVNQSEYPTFHCLSLQFARQIHLLSNSPCRATYLLHLRLLVGQDQLLKLVPYLLQYLLEISLMLPKDPSLTFTEYLQRLTESQAQFSKH